MKHMGTSVLLLISLYVCTEAAAQSHPCAALLKLDLKSRRAFLVSQESTRTSPCITQVISSLKGDSAPKTIGVLISYLDYMDPSTGAAPAGGSFKRPNYPAISALFVTGKPAAPWLLSAIERTGSELLQKNASLTYSFIYRDELAEGIQKLKERQGRAEPRGSAQLARALQMLSDFCKAGRREEAAKCEKVGNKGLQQ
jgi:hypothetical protein